MQMRQAVDCIYQEHSRGYQHNYQAEWQILDVDMSGWLCGKKAEFASQPRNRRGRQLGRVLATRYQEVVVDELFAGNCQLNTTLQELVEAAEVTLDLTEEKRAHCPARASMPVGAASPISTGSWSAATTSWAKPVRDNRPAAWLKRCRNGSPIRICPSDRSAGLPRPRRTDVATSAPGGGALP
jgi:hypothetical protein